MIRLKKYRRGNAGAEIRMHAYAYLYVKRIRMSCKIRDAGTILDKARQAEIESQREVKTNKRKKRVSIHCQAIDEAPIAQYKNPRARRQRT